MDLPELASVLVRGGQTAAALSLFGTLVFRLTIARAALRQAAPAVAQVLARRLGRVAGWSLLLAVLGALVWLVLETAAIAGGRTAAAIAAALPAVALHTRFGHLLLLRLALLVGSGGCFARAVSDGRQGAAAALAGIAVAVQAGMGHAAAMGGAGAAGLVATEMLHLLAAGGWLGGLLPLFITLAAVPTPAAAAVSRRFSPLGMTCVLLLAATALAQGAALVGSVGALVGTAYGQVAMLKLALFAALIALALAV
jgi:putative copper resistance protein D